MNLALSVGAVVVADELTASVEVCRSTCTGGLNFHTENDQIVDDTLSVR